MIHCFFYNNRELRIDLSPNESFGLLPCVVCGTSNIKQDRIDTESVFGKLESYCFPHWYKSLRY